MFLSAGTCIWIQPRVQQLGEQCLIGEESSCKPDEAEPTAMPVTLDSLRDVGFVRFDMDIEYLGHNGLGPAHGNRLLSSPCRRKTGVVQARAAM